MEEIYLKQITKSQKPELIKISDRLVSGEVILNCQDVTNLKPKQLNWLLDRIPNEWQNTEELYRFIDLNTLEAEFRVQLIERLSRSSTKRKIYHLNNQFLLALVLTVLLISIARSVLTITYDYSN